ncbi:MAG: gfo/Idh/MocA family oxidoreductase, partial [Verrucomicrobiales bacterium]|nr:gfo/Idh/MocA family oxidoreductase [Verrucomicrobiales bacterium]
GDWGVHWLDQVLAWTDQRYPKRVFSTAGRPVRGAAVTTDTEQTTDAPDHQVAVYEFEGFTLTWEHRMFGENQAEKHHIGAYFYGHKGTLHLGWKDGWTFYPANSREKIVHEDAQLQEPDGHNLKLLWADFLDAIEHHRPPAADIEPAHRASVMAFLGMISCKVGRSLVWDGTREEIVGDAAASALMGATYRAPWVMPTS